MTDRFLVEIPVTMVDHHPIHLALHRPPVLDLVGNAPCACGFSTQFGGFAPEMGDLHGNETFQIADFCDSQGVGIFGTDDSESDGLVVFFHKFQAGWE